MVSSSDEYIYVLGAPRIKFEEIKEMIECAKSGNQDFCLDLLSLISLKGIISLLILSIRSLNLVTFWTGKWVARVIKEKVGPKIFDLLSGKTVSTNL